jgi:hypothetical protein
VQDVPRTGAGRVGDRVHRVHVAEQVSVERTSDQVADVLAKAQPEWFEAVAALAWRDGELAEARRYGAGASRRESEELPRHLFEIDPPTPRNRGEVSREFRWVVNGPTSLFHELTRKLITYPFGDLAVLALYGAYESLDNSDDWGDGAGSEQTGAANRPVEVAVRAFLGHLRTAFESV